MRSDWRETDVQTEWDGIDEASKVSNENQSER